MKSIIQLDWKMIRNFYSKVLIWWCFIKHGNSVPIDYCLHPLDQNDCGLKPTPVFSYYKPGSRCEVEIWRGCPTFNKFSNEVLCSHHCIGKLWGRTDDNQLHMMMMEVEEGAPFDECSMPMNYSDCGVKEQFKYTFIDDVCVIVAWKGCQSHNMFENEETCINACNPKTTYNLQDKLEKLPMYDVEVINDILEGVMAENTPRSAPILQLKIQMDKDSEGSIETTVAETTSTQTEEITKIEEITNKGEETTIIVEETTKNVEKTTSEIVETTVAVTEAATRAIVEETTNNVDETTTAIVETTVIVTGADTTQVIATIEAATEGDGSAEEVVLT